MPMQTTRRLALATCEHLPGIHPDDVHLAAALAARGIEPVACTWSDPSVDWAGFDAVLIATDHDAIEYGSLADWAPVIVDTRNAFGRRAITGANIVKA